MKVTSEYNLPEEQDEYLQAANGWKYWMVLWDMREWLIQTDKDKNGVLEKCTDKYDLIDIVLDKFMWYLETWNVNIDEVQ